MEEQPEMIARKLYVHPEECRVFGLGESMAILPLQICESSIDLFTPTQRRYIGQTIIKIKKESQNIGKEGHAARRAAASGADALVGGPTQRIVSSFSVIMNTNTVDESNLMSQGTK